MESRISARLDEQTSLKLATIRATTHQSVTEVIANAIDLYHRSLQVEACAGNRNLLSLAGIFDGPPELSVRYKEELGELLDEKCPDHR